MTTKERHSLTEAWITAWGIEHNYQKVLKYYRMQLLQLMTMSGAKI